MKVLLIIFGSLFALMLIAIVGIALMLPMLGKKLNADSNDPVARARTLAKIADFRVPPGYRIETVSDIAVSQSVTLAPTSRDARDSTILQLSSQHYANGNLNDSLDAMGTGFGLTAKLMRCDLKRLADDDVSVNRKPIVLRSYGCKSGTTDVHFEVGIVTAKASTVQIIATSMKGEFDKAGVDALVASIR